MSIGSRDFRFQWQGLSDGFGLGRLCVFFVVLGAFLTVGVGALPTSVNAQGSHKSVLESVMLKEVVVTARKREESIQDVPLSVEYFDSEQIDALKIRDLTDLSVRMPNVALDDAGTMRGIANFSIRGLGINSSIPSIDPTVGVFVDGVYMGTTLDTVLDTFDLESVEVLRGPQGILFGRNVTGGAILINTKKPGDQFEFSLRTSAESGGEKPNFYLMGSMGGPLSDSIGAKLSFYTNQDKGWFKNLNTGDAFGERDSIMLRPVVTLSPSDNLEFVFRYEYHNVDGDGPAAQSHGNRRGDPNNQLPDFKRNSHKFSIDEEGFQKADTHFFNTRMDWDVSVGDGTITNIFGWRDYEGKTRVDADASPANLFHADAWYDARQYSNELRYTGSFYDNLRLTTGVYYFNNELDYHERRSLLGGVMTQDGGGNYEVRTLGLFMALDYDLTSRLTLTAGARYTNEKKKAKIASLVDNWSRPDLPLRSPCNIVKEGGCTMKFQDSKSWNNLSPKLGLSYQLRDDTLVYSHWTRGFRSGGYNLRDTGIINPLTGEATTPGPFGAERIDSFETGFKVDAGNRGRFNGAFFYNLVDDMQRELNLPNSKVGVAQEIRNTADVEIFGFELDGVLALVDNLFLLASVGYLNPEYTKVKHDLNDDGEVNDKDKDLDPPRAAEWTYSVGLIYEAAVGNWGSVAPRVNYAYRDKSFFTDSNLGFIDKQKMLDAGVDFYSYSSQWSIGVYGKNLLNEVKHGGDTVLPSKLDVAPLGGTFSPLAKGRIYGVQLTYGFAL